MSVVWVPPSSGVGEGGGATEVEDTGAGVVDTPSDVDTTPDDPTLSTWTPARRVGFEIEYGIGANVGPCKCDILSLIDSRLST